MANKWIWMPIETAPKDKPMWLFGIAHSYDGYYRPNAKVIGRWDKSIGGWRITGCGAPREERIAANFWFPIPDDPK